MSVDSPVGSFFIFSWYSVSSDWCTVGHGPLTATLFNRFSVQCHVGIYVISKTGTEEYTRKTVEKEKHIEDFLEKHVTVLDADVFVIGRQVRTGDKTQ